MNVGATEHCGQRDEMGRLGTGVESVGEELLLIGRLVRECREDDHRAVELNTELALKKVLNVSCLKKKS